MFIAFENGKCPICGSAGKKIDEGIFFCYNCDIPFNEFCVPDFCEPTYFEDFYWN